MDETYALATMAGVRFYYRISSSVVSSVPVVTFSYGSYRPPPHDTEVSQFNEEIKTFSRLAGGDAYIDKLRQYVQQLGYKLCPSTVPSAS